MKHYYVYIMASASRTLYVGVTNNLERRVYQHKTKSNPTSFTARYDVNKLVFSEVFGDVKDAISAEKRIKGWKRYKKTNLIETENPKWRDISAEWDDMPTGECKEALNGTSNSYQ